MTFTVTSHQGAQTTSTTTIETTKSEEQKVEQANVLLNQTHDASQLNSSGVNPLIFSTVVQSSEMLDKHFDKLCKLMDVAGGALGGYAGRAS